ncbi:VOC family protein [Alteriqipengyuania flavescens]|uniref:VOC family protein n=1 Tax=Alteriqipengyuania flavescens TaxID=3053610 RepID=UPI0025B48B15|nr:VOC family protein [Alteriqipengyuania flavescens]WJY18890.1 VOC family protein [Alteriqipengyuania flavescens]WJY24830.1 VOC family protein [Alteriqipengyuania flavescens]
MADGHGDFVWYELMTSDADAAQAFYEPLLGWKFADSGTPGMDYRLGKAAGADVVGLLGLTEEMTAGGARPVWVGYIAVTDIAAAMDSLTSAGGQPFMDIQHMPGVGKMAMVADPQGAPFYLMQPEGEGSTSFAKHEPKVGHCAWNELASADQSAAHEFYTDLFGWEKADTMDMGEMGAYDMYSVNGYTLGAIMAKPAEMPVSLWSYYFRVPEIDGAAEYVKANGGQIIVGPMEIPGGEHVFSAIDPQGAMFSLIGKKG